MHGTSKNVFSLCVSRCRLSYAGVWWRFPEIFWSLVILHCLTIRGGSGISSVSSECHLSYLIPTSSVCFECKHLHFNAEVFYLPSDPDPGLYHQQSENKGGGKNANNKNCHFRLKACCVLLIYSVPEGRVFAFCPGGRNGFVKWGHVGLALSSPSRGQLRVRIWACPGLPRQHTVLAQRHPNPGGWKWAKASVPWAKPCLCWIIVDATSILN